MWKNLAEFVVAKKWMMIGLLLLATAFMAYQASKVQLSYEFSKAIPTSSPVYKDYQKFREKFGDDGNLLVIGVQTDAFFKKNNFDAYRSMVLKLKQTKFVEDILSVTTAMALQTSEETGKLEPVSIFADSNLSQLDIDAAQQQFEGIGFYKNLLYNPDTRAYLLGVRLNKDVLASDKRTALVQKITNTANNYTAATGVKTHLSGLPLIRTVVADMVQKEMKLFLIGSLLLSVLMMLLFFRSVSSVIISLMVVAVGVIWAVGFIVLCGYKITLLTALIPTLVVVIGIPNCIYFFNKYHTAFQAGAPKRQAIIEMVSKMGVVTLFCNITAAIGFAVFALTKSDILIEFGVVAGLSIFFIFIISFIILPAALDLLPPPGKRQLAYLNTGFINKLMAGLEHLVVHRYKTVLLATVLVVIISIAGMLRLNHVAKIVDDLPQEDIVYRDLKFFEKHFGGVMPLEILIDTRKPKGILKPEIDINTIATFQDSVLNKFAQIGRPLSVVDGVKFSYQAVSGTSGDSAYTLPAFGNPFIDLHKSMRAMQLKQREGMFTAKDSAMQKLMGSFVDSTEQYLRISMSMQDIGTQQLPLLLDSIQAKAKEIFNDNYEVMLTGTSLSFLEGSKYIVNGLKESILWAFALIAVCMLYLFKNFKILICSLIPNIIPLLVTAGVMGWAGVNIKPSTVLVFSVALGIAVDITIRFLVNYKQVLKTEPNPQQATIDTLHQTGLSIIYTSIVLSAGFIIFCASNFGGTFALGWLTSLTLVVATATNLVLLPVLLRLTAPKNKPV